MRFLKKILSFVAGCVLIWKISAVGFVSAEEAPHDIKLTCETKYIDIDEIPEDRVVKLAVSIDNNPGFLALSILIDIDPNLKYDHEKLCEIVTVNDDIVCINYSYSKEVENRICFDIMTDSNTYLFRNDELMYLRLILPETVCGGDVFNVKIIPKDDNYCTEMYMDSDAELRYGVENFSELNDGGIYITDDKQVEQNNENQTNEEKNIEQRINENESNLIQNYETSNEVTTIITAVTTPIITSSLKTKKVTTMHNTNTTTSLTKNTTPNIVSVTEKHRLDYEKTVEDKDITLLIVATMTALSVSGVLFIITKSKNNKHEK